MPLQLAESSVLEQQERFANARIWNPSALTQAHKCLMSREDYRGPILERFLTSSGYWGLSRRIPSKKWGPLFKLGRQSSSVGMLEDMAPAPQWPWVVHKPFIFRRGTLDTAICLRTVLGRRDATIILLAVRTPPVKFCAVFFNGWSTILFLHPAFIIRTIKCFPY